MSSARLPQRPLVIGSPPQSARLVPLRNNIGFRVDITPTGVSDIYDYSLGRPDGRDSFSLCCPLEFDLCFIRIFYNSSAARVGSVASPEDVQNAIDAFYEQTPRPSNARRLTFKDDEERAVEEPRTKPISVANPTIKPEDRDELIYKYRYLNSLEIQVILGSTILWYNRLGTLDRFCLWDRNPSEDRKTIYMAETESALLLNTGYTVNCFNAQRTAKRISSNERVQIRFVPNEGRLPTISIGLEVVLEGLMYCHL